MSEVTRLLNAVERGEAAGGGAAEELLPLVYEELRRLAAARMAGERPGQTLQPTALVHEAWLRLVGPDAPQWNSRNHFFAAAAEAMRRILVERARRKLAVKHGAGLVRVEGEGTDIAEARDSEELLQVHEVLDALARESSVQAEVVKLRFFVGLSHSEIATALDVSEQTSKRYWAHAKAWLRLRLKGHI